MSMGNQLPVTPQPFGVGDQMTSANQQAIPVAYIAGTRKIAVQAMSKTYNLVVAPAPNNNPNGKK